MKNQCSNIGNMIGFVFLTKRQFTSFVKKTCSHEFATYNTKNGIVTRCIKCKKKIKL